MVLLASKDRKRFFVVASLRDLPAGDFPVATLRREERSVSAEALAEYEVPEKVAMLVARAEQGAAQQLKQEVEAFKARLQQQLDHAADEAASTMSLQEVFKRMGLDFTPWMKTSPESALAQDLMATLGDGDKPFSERWQAAMGRLQEAGFTQQAKSLDAAGRELAEAVRLAAEHTRDNPDAQGYEAGKAAGEAARRAKDGE